MNKNKPINVLILSDGLPGHANQARGLVNWLSRRYAVKSNELSVKLRYKGLAQLLLPWLLHHQHSPTTLISWFYSYPQKEIEKPDLIISAGGNTSFLNVALARDWQIPNIFIGSRRRLYSSDFSAHLTLEPTGQANNIVMELSPTLTNIAVLLNQGQQLRETLNIQREQKLYMLALGGDGAGYRYNQESCQQMSQLMTELSLRDNCRWILTTSRRTGSVLEKALKQLIDPNLLADAVWWHDNPRKVMNAYMGAVDCIFISIDSMSMISEAIASNKPTILLQPEMASPEPRYQQALDDFYRAGYCTILPLGSPPPLLKSVNNKSSDAREKLLDKLEEMLSILKIYP